MATSGSLVRFDWAMKYLLRDKANFDILEGFLSALLEKDIKVLNLIESESNQEHEYDKFNRVDLLVEDDQKQKIIIEVQNDGEADYFERLLYGTSKLVVDNMRIGSKYSEVAKIISISILFFNLGKGDDYIYYGKTEFEGVHSHKPLYVREKVQTTHLFDSKVSFKKKENIFPEYYLIRTDKFENVIQSPIDEWIYMIKNSEVRTEFKSKNIHEAEKRLKILAMSDTERKKYERDMIKISDELSFIEGAKEEGWEKGLEKGREEGKVAILVDLIRFKFGEMSESQLATLTGCKNPDKLDAAARQVLVSNDLQVVLKALE